MIQRKQTLYLLLSLVIFGSLFFIELGSFAGPKGIFVLKFFGLIDITQAGSSQLVFPVLSLAAVIATPALLILIDIFLFKRRPLQMRVCGISCGLQVGVAVLLFIIGRMFAAELEVEWTFHYACLLPIASATATYMAYRRIDEDEAIIRSLNRLR